MGGATAAARARSGHWRRNRCGGRGVKALRQFIRVVADQVEIITAKNQNPTPAWREFVVTGRARSAINRYLHSQQKDEQIKLGREILDKAAKRDELEFTEKDLSKVFKHHNLQDLDDLYAGLAQGRLFPRQIFEILFPKDKQDKEPSNEDIEIQVGEKKEKQESRADSSSIAIQGLTPGIVIHIAKCCSPLPGEPIVGIITTGRGVTIHSKNCKNLESLSDQPDRWLPVSWSDENFKGGDKSFSARLRLSLTHEPGALSSLTTAIYNVDGNIVDLHIESKSTDLYMIQCDVEVRNLDHFKHMMTALRNLKCVKSVERAVG